MPQPEPTPHRATQPVDALTRVREALVLLRAIEGDLAALIASRDRTPQEPACLWAHGPVADLDKRGLCPICAEED